MKRFKDLHKGQTCIIIGNGPSLRKIPKRFLEKFPSFGSNRGYLWFLPTYYCVVNPLVIEQFLGEIMQLEAEALFLPDSLQFAGGNMYYLKQIYGEPTFSKDITEGIHAGWTVTYVCLQLAYYMGFSTALLVGVDHRYLTEGMPNQEKIAVGPDPNHFDPNYFSGGTRWNNPDLRMSQVSYRLAKEAYEADGRRIVNLTPGTALEIFEKDDWRKW
jgi:hypothetical protein